MNSLITPELDGVPEDDDAEPADAEVNNPELPTDDEPAEDDEPAGTSE